MEKCLPILDFGDHNTAILADLACQPKYSKHLKKVDFESLKSYVKNIISMFTTTNSIETPIDNLWTKFNKNIIGIQKRHVSRRMTPQRFSQPWITRECNRKIRKKREHTKNSKEQNLIPRGS